MGLIRGMARTAAIAGTATAVSGRVARRQQARWDQQDYPPDYTQAAPAPSPAYAPAPAPAPASGEDLTAGLQRLAALHDQGVLTEDEFAAAKAKLLGI